MQNSFAEVNYNGSLDRIDLFYEIIGVKCSQGIVTFREFNFFFNDLGNAPNFRIRVDVDVDINIIESKLVLNGFCILEVGFDGSGPFLLSQDPAGTEICIGLNAAGLEAFLRRTTTQAEPDTRL